MLSWRRTALKRNVIVNLKSGESFRGVLWTKSGPLLILKNAYLFASSASEPAKVDGEVLVERSNVAFIQLLPEA